MTKQQYLSMRKTGQYDLGLFYQYYLENKSKEVPTHPFEVFVQLARFYLNGIVEALDVKFKIQKVEDISGNLIHIA
jgi:hypothetical protein